MGANRCQINGRTRLRVSNWVSKPSPGGPTRTTKWYDKATHLYAGSVIAVEVPESRYWVRSIFCLRSKRSLAMAMSHRWPCPFLLTVRAVPALYRFGTTVCRVPCTEETGSIRSSFRQIFPWA